MDTLLRPNLDQIADLFADALAGGTFLGQQRRVSAVADLASEVDQVAHSGGLARSRAVDVVKRHPALRDSDDLPCLLRPGLPIAKPPALDRPNRHAKQAASRLMAHFFDVVGESHAYAV